MSHRSSCPDPLDARHEGERVGYRGYRSDNPYEDMPWNRPSERCDEAADEFERGRRAGEQRREEEAAEERAAQARAERRREEANEEARYEQQYYEQQHAAEQFPDPPSEG